MIRTLAGVCALAGALSAGTLDTARDRYYAAVDGDDAAFREAKQFFDAARAAQPNDALTSVYAGSILLLESSKVLAPWRKGKLAKEGLALMDNAVERAPDHPEVRFVRAASTSKLPGFFRRAEQSAEDFAWLASRAAAAVTAGTLPTRLGAAALLNHGVNREKAGDTAAARAAWTEAVRIGKETAAAADARKRLQAVTEASGQRSKP